MQEGYCRYRIVALLLLVAFTGQAVAAASISCDNTSSLAHFSADIEIAEMGHPHSAGPDASSTENHDCIQQCACTLNGCAYSALPAPDSASPFSVTPTIGHFDESVISRISAPLFRPPILH